MQRFNPEWLYVLTGHGYFGRRNLARAPVDPDERYPEEAVASAVALYEKVHQECLALGLRTASITASQVMGALRERQSRGKIVDLLEQLSHRILDELSYEFFLQLTPQEAERYEKWESGWEKIIAKFPDTARDVEEMNKCFALGRYTASMFHALHVAEWGAISLGVLIGVDDAKRGWGATKNKLKTIIQGGHCKLPPELSGKFEFLEQMNREIESMALAWRNKVDHAANHLYVVPNTEFTADIAKHVISAVRVFMIRLDEGLTTEDL